MRAKKVATKTQHLSTISKEFLTYKKAQKLRERTIEEYEKEIARFLEQSADVMDADVLKTEVLYYFSNIPATSPAVFNHPYEYLHAFFGWCVKQDYLLYNPFDKLDLKKRRDDGHILPAEINDIKAFLKCLDKTEYSELRDYVITLIILDTGIRTSEILSLSSKDYDPDKMTITVRAEVAKTSRERKLYLSSSTNNTLKKFIRVKDAEWKQWLFPSRDGNQLCSNQLARNFRKYCKRSGVQFTPYQLRHSFATFYLENGGDLFTLQRQMGHSDLQMTKRYTEISHGQIEKSHEAFSPVKLLQPAMRKCKV